MNKHNTNTHSIMVSIICEYYLEKHKQTIISEKTQKSLFEE